MTCGSCRYDGWRQRGRERGRGRQTRSVTVAGRLTICGGGVMGLVTAYHAALLAEAVTTWPLPAASTPAGMTSWRTMSSSWARCTARMTCSPGWGGAGLDTSSPRGWAKCSPSFAVQRGTVYNIGRFTPARFAGGATDEPLAGGMAS